MEQRNEEQRNDHQWGWRHPWLLCERWPPYRPRLNFTFINITKLNIIISWIKWLLSMFGKNQPYRKSCQWVALGCHQISFHVNHSTVMDQTGPVTNQSFRRCSHYRDKWHITATISTTAQDTNEISWMVHFRCWQREFFAKYPLLNVTATTITNCNAQVQLFWFFLQHMHL